jgi:hypothetical protein
MVRRRVLAGAAAATVLSLGAFFFLLHQMTPHSSSGAIVIGDGPTHIASPRDRPPAVSGTLMTTPALPLPALPPPPIVGRGAGSGTGGGGGVGGSFGKGGGPAGAGFAGGGGFTPIAERVKAAAQPAKVEFAVPVKMTMGLRYQARLELLRDGAKTRFLRGNENIVISEELKILDKVRASIESTDLKIDRLGDEWQEILPGGRGLWLWGIEPLRPGDAHLVVNIHHAAVVDGIERRFLVDTFPRTVKIEVDWWGRVQSVATAAPAFLSSTVGLIGSFSTLAGLGAGCLVWARRRKGRGSEQAELPIDTSDSKAHQNTSRPMAQLSSATPAPLA